ncbi:MAG: regulator of sirC expression with transglutaminase-like and TPR domain [Planctomycetota bacterium]
MANAGRRGLTVRSIAELVACEPDEIDLATAALVIAKELDPQLDIDAKRLLIDELARGLLTHAKDARAAQDQADWILWYLHADQGFQPGESPFPSPGRFIHDVLDARRGNCSGLSALYMSVAERVGWDLQARLAPLHVFVRLTAEGEAIDLEPTVGGSYVEGGLTEMFFFSDEQRNGTLIYTRPMSKHEHVGMMLSELVRPLLFEGRLDRALFVAKHGARLAPRLPAPNLALAWVHSERGDHKQARDMADLAIAADPLSASILLRCTEMALNSDDWTWAAECSSKAIAIAPTEPTAHMRMAEAQQGLRRFTEVIEAVKTARALPWTDLHETQQFLLAVVWKSHDQFEHAALSMLGLAHGSIAIDMESSADGLGDGTTVINHHEAMRHLHKAGVALELARSFSDREHDATVLARLPLAIASDEQHVDDDYRSMRAELDARLASAKSEASDK